MIFMCFIGFEHLGTDYARKIRIMSLLCVFYKSFFAGILFVTLITRLACSVLRLKMAIKLRFKEKTLFTLHTHKLFLPNVVFIYMLSKISNLGTPKITLLTTIVLLFQVNC